MMIRPLSKELQTRAKTELNEIPHRIREDLDHIKEWISKQPHLKVRTDDQWLLAFLRTCKFSLQNTKEKLDMFYTVRSSFPRYFTNRDPYLPEVKEYFKQHVLVQLPATSEISAPSRFLVTVNSSDPKTLPMKSFLKDSLMIIDMLLCKDDDFVISGLEIVVDLSGLPYNYIGQLTPNFIKTFVFILQDVYPIRPKAIYYINYSTFFHIPLKLFLSLLSSKIRNRVHLYPQSNFDQFYKVIPQCVFPNEYGGQAGPIAELADKLNRRLEEHYKWFLEDSQYGSDESKRIGKPKKTINFFSLGESFRKVDID